MQTRNFDFDKILRILLRHRVDFIIVGGVAAVLHGAPVNTNDLDIVKFFRDRPTQQTP